MLFNLRNVTYLLTICGVAFIRRALYGVPSWECNLFVDITLATTATSLSPPPVSLCVKFKDLIGCHANNIQQYIRLTVDSV